MDDKQKFVADLYPAARKVSQETGMSWKLILAQAAQETGWGKKVLEGTNNIFNIKVGAEWKGPQKTFNVWEVEDNKKVWRDQSFRVYDSIEDALRDRVKFLGENPRYMKAGLFDEGTLGNLHTEAVALQKAGYATDPNYAKNLEQVFNSRTMSLGIALSIEQKVAIEATIPALCEGDNNPAVGELQSHLRDLGYTDAQGQVLQPDNKFGQRTREAVEAFQRDHGLRDDGIAGRHTLQAIQGQRVLVGVVPAFAPGIRSEVLGHAPHMPTQQEEVVQATHRIDDPRNPLHAQHALYTKLGQRIPDASEERLMQFTAACHTKGITADNLYVIHLNEQTKIIHFTASWPPGKFAQADLTQPPPSPQQSMQQMQSFDQMQAHSMARFQAQQAQINAQAQQGPVLDGGPMR